MIDRLLLPTSAVAPTRDPVCIDLRPAAAYRRGHRAGSANVPLEDLETRLFELPPPGEWALTLVGAREDLASARAFLGPKGWQADEADIALPSVARSLTAVGNAERGARSPFRPNAFLAAALEALTLSGTGALNGANESGLSLDLGCGSGRDAVYLARALAPHTPAWRVRGVDNHGGALVRARSLAERELDEARPDVAPPDEASPAAPDLRCDFVHADLRKAGGLEAAVSAAPPVRLVHGCRWLDLSVLSRLPSLLAPGGVLLWSTFLDPVDGEPLRPPYRRSRRLARGQMAELLGGQHGMRVLLDQEGELLTRGEWIPAQHFVAVRPHH